MNKKLRILGFLLLLTSIILVILCLYFNNIIVSIGVFALILLGGFIFIIKVAKSERLPTLIFVLTDLLIFLGILLFSGEL